MNFNQKIIYTYSTNMQLEFVPCTQKGKNEQKKIHDVIAMSFLNLMKTIKPLIQESQ